MKKSYSSPVLEMLPFCADTAIAALTGNPAEDPEGSQPWNNGELGWGWT